MAFEPFDLGRVIQTAEAIKGMRRQSVTDSLREQYMQTQIDNAKAQEQRAAAQFGQDQQVSNTKLLNAAAAEIAVNPQAAERWLPQLQKAGVVDPTFDWRTMQPEELKGVATELYTSTSKALSAMGLMSDEEKLKIQGQLEDKRLQGQRDFTRSQQEDQQAFTAEQNRLSRESRPSNQKGSFRALTPAEVQQVGLPAGTSAQVDEATGKIDVLSKRDTTATLSQKDAATARQKLTTVQMAKRQVANLRRTFEEGRSGMNAFGPGQGLLPTQAGKKFDAAIDQMRGTWTGLKRVPGVGAMSDYESRMDAAQFPSRNDYESVIEQKLQGMEDQLALLENGYTGLLSGNAPEPAAQAPQPQQQQGIDQQGYDSLPSGTQYRAPDGTIRVKR